MTRGALWSAAVNPVSKHLAYASESGQVVLALPSFSSKTRASKLPHTVVSSMPHQLSHDLVPEGMTWLTSYRALELSIRALKLNSMGVHNDESYSQSAEHLEGQPRCCAAAKA